MLVRLAIENYRSIADAVELSMVAVDRDRAEARPSEPLGVDLLTRVAVYGANASGKSNVLGGLAWLVDAVRFSLRTWEEVVPTEPHAFGDWRARDSRYLVETYTGGVRFAYELEVDASGVSYEALHHYPSRKRRLVFEREGTSLKLQRGLGSAAGIRDLLTPRTLVLSVARRFEFPIVRDFVSELLGVHVVQPNHRVRGALSRSRHATLWAASLFDGPSSQPTLFDGDSSMDVPGRDRALAMLRMADLGIDDVEVRSEFLESAGGVPREVRRIRFVHSTPDGGVSLDASEESAGTQTWFGLIHPVLQALSRGSLLVVDEIDASLHPVLSASLLELFGSRESNPKGAQLLFSTHDVSLLGHLNRDEVWLTEKAPDGSTRLGALAEFAGERVRRSQNLESGYLGGRFGALPIVSNRELLQALGLVR